MSLYWSDRGSFDRPDQKNDILHFDLGSLAQYS
jgi:hypothetical protein